MGYVRSGIVIFKKLIGAYADSAVSVIIHEASHFLDTMATTDEQYYITPFLSAWGRSHPDLAINNADSIAGYVVDGD
ncbi:M35 family metallo-endopeptidase [Burkholderia pseudomultivorans]|uniref:Lysine-specific metallo-endopeptidase domain-containing protein n=1 Tax=Burkholderia pseudomultivorans TaxID=1207504 RepID=A0A132EZJ2_9BURK|nr:M35 family metallo-endopeptidase [Burkholderia pseudomultivorans]KWF64642.1 hypothetical protein WT57_21295 [Burkholderia pseudomultivorans]